MFLFKNFIYKESMELILYSKKQKNKIKKKNQNSTIKII